MKKVIGIGNRIMKDDSIGIRVVENLKEDLYKLGYSVVIAETDIDYAIGEISSADELIILDSSIFGNSPGEVKRYTLNEMDCINEKTYSLHQFSLIKVLKTIGMSNFKGYLITIEAKEIDFGVELSKELTEKFYVICRKILNLIEEIE